MPRATPSPPRLWFLTSAGPSIGFGHLRRCTVLAELLATRFRPSFVSYPDDVWTPAWARRHGWQDVALGSHLIESHAGLPAGMIIDTRRQESAQWALSEALRHGVPVLSIHDLGLDLLPSNVVVDGSVDPAHPSGVFRGSKYLSGPDFMVLDPSCARACPGCPEGRVTRIFIGLGGGCRGDLLEVVLRGIGAWRIDAEVIALPGFVGLATEDFRTRTVPLPNFRWATGNGSVAEALAGCGIAITAGGVTAYEALAVGVPLVGLSNDEHQARTLCELERRGLCIYLGPGEGLAPATVTAALARLDEDPGLRRESSRRGRMVVDGLGAERVASEVCDMATRLSRGGIENAEFVEGAAVRP